MQSISRLQAREGSARSRSWCGFTRRAMGKHTHVGLTILTTSVLVIVGSLFAVAENRVDNSFRTHEEDEAVPPPVEARDIPVEQYLKLKTTALSNAVAQISPRTNNPRISAAGLDPAVLAILEEQQRYLRASEHVHAISLQRTSKPLANQPGAASLGLLCPSPVIAAVNGRAVGPVFTPRLGQNHYRIEGCGFGRGRGEVRLVPDSSVGLSARPITLLAEGLSAWSDGEINVRLDPRLAGIPDWAATLVIQLADGREVELPGCRFVAVRGQPVALKTIPASWVRLSATGGNHVLPQLEYVSPPAADTEIPLSAGTASALVIRSDIQALEGGTDTYEFFGLNPGWAVESVRIQKYSAACPGDVTQVGNSGEWNTRFNESSFTVGWASTNCSSFIPPAFRFSMAASEYALTVWVTGPIGTEPLRNTPASVTHKIE